MKIEWSTDAFILCFPLMDMFLTLRINYLGVSEALSMPGDVSCKCGLSVLMETSRVAVVVVFFGGAPFSTKEESFHL